MNNRTKEIQPCTTNLCEVCKQIYDKKEDGVNSLQTLNPDGHIKKHCAKLNGGVDAVAGADNKWEKFRTERLPLITFILTVMLLLLNVIRTLFA